MKNRLTKLVIPLLIIQTLILGYIAVNQRQAIQLQQQLFDKISASDRIPLTVSLTQQADLLCYNGPDISSFDHWVYHSVGNYIQPPRLDYSHGKNCWQLTDEIKDTFPNWQTNQSWAVDFLWPSQWPLPPQARIGTTSR